MKRLLLHFENKIGKMLMSAALSVIFGPSAFMCFFHGDIGIGVFAAFVAIASFIFFLYLILYVEVVIDFKHNRLKMRSGKEKRVCDLDKVEKLEIVFQWVEKMGCYSAKIKAYLKGGRSLAIKIIPEGGWTRSGPIYSGRIFNRSKKKIECKAGGYDFIVCRTEEPKR